MYVGFLGFLALLLSVLGGIRPAVAAADKVELEIAPDGPGAPRGGRMGIEVFAHIAPGWHIQGHEPNQPYLIATDLHLVVPPGVETETVQYPRPDSKKFAFAGDQELLVYEGKLGMATVVAVPDAYRGDSLRIEADLRYQACNETTCLPPTTARRAIQVPVVARSAQNEVFDEAPPDSGPAVAGGAARFEHWMAERGLLFTLLAVALLGLGLNLTPCVYPLISVTIAYFGGQARERRRVTWLAVLYVLGIALSFSTLGLAAALSGGVFGAALQRPPVIVFIAAVLVVLALSSFGLYQLQPPAALMRWAGNAGSGALGSIFMGLTMGVVAAPCVGPIVLGLLLFVGSRQDPLLGFSLFFALAVGMGAPYLVLATAAGSIKKLPRSGEWLLWTERLFGCILLSLATYFVSPLLVGSMRSLALPVVIGASGLYLGFIDPAGRSLRFFPVVKGFVGAGMLAAAVWLGSPTTASQPIKWESIRAFARGGDGAADGRPVLIDFAAEWCIPCREMDHTTYVDDDVVREADRFRMVRADLTEDNDHTSSVVERYDVRGVPTVVLLAPDGREKQRFVGYVGPQQLLEAMRSIR
jgi:thiol:disulfide interchange protein DsbD